MIGSLAARDISKSFGAVQVLEHVSLVVSAGDRVGIVGPNGIGKSTLLRVLAGLEQPDRGTVVRSGEAGYLPQEPEIEAEETILESLSRRAGVSAAAAEMDAVAERLAAEPGLATTHAEALDRFLALGGGDFAARAGVTLADVGLAGAAGEQVRLLSGGEAARVSLAAILLARFDVFLLDEPTNNLDFAGLERLERFLAGLAAGVVLVSHDRAFLDRTVTRMVEIEAETRRVHEYAGAWSDYEAARERARVEHERAYAQYIERRGEVEQLLGERRSQAQALGGARKLARQTGGSDRRATNACVRRSPRRGASSSRSSRSTSRGRPGGSSSRSPDHRRRARSPRSTAQWSSSAASASARSTSSSASATASPSLGPNGSRQDDAAPGARRRAPARLGEPRAGRATVFGQLEQGRSRFTGILLADFAEQSALPPARHGRCSPSSHSEPTTSRAPPPPSPRASAPAPRSHSSPPAASTVCSSTSRPTTSTSRRSRSSNARSRPTRALSSSSATTAASSIGSRPTARSRSAVRRRRLDVRRVGALVYPGDGASSPTNASATKASETRGLADPARVRRVCGCVVFAG